VWGATAAPASPSAYISSTSLRVHGSSGVGCHSNSSITKHVHQLPERARQLRCGAPQLLRRHQARTSTPVWGAAATPSSPSAHTAPPPRECTAAPVWGAAAAPASPSTYISSPSACINSSVGCHSNSVITKRARSSPEGLYLKTPTIISNDRGTARKEGGKRRWYPRLLRRLRPIPGERRVGSRCIRRPIIVKAES